MTGGFAGSIVTSCRRNDAHERVIDRPLQLCGRRARARPGRSGHADLLCAGATQVAPLVQRLQKQHGPLPRVRPILGRWAEPGLLLRHNLPPGRRPKQTRSLATFGPDGGLLSWARDGPLISSSVSCEAAHPAVQADHIRRILCSIGDNTDGGENGDELRGLSVLS